MKKLLLITFLAFSFGVNAQYYGSVTYINVSQENVAEVARLRNSHIGQKLQKLTLMLVSKWVGVSLQK